MGTHRIQDLAADEGGMTIQVNGEPRKVGQDATVQEILVLLGVSPGEKGVAVALDGTVVFRKDWETASVRPGSKVEIVRAVAGG